MSSLNIIDQILGRDKTSIYDLSPVNRYRLFIGLIEKMKPYLKYYSVFHNLEVKGKEMFFVKFPRNFPGINIRCQFKSSIDKLLIRMLAWTTKKVDLAEYSNYKNWVQCFLYLSREGELFVLEAAIRKEDENGDQIVDLAYLYNFNDSYIDLFFGEKSSAEVFTILANTFLEDSEKKFERAFNQRYVSKNFSDTIYNMV